MSSSLALFLQSLALPVQAGESLVYPTIGNAFNDLFATPDNISFTIGNALEPSVGIVALAIIITVKVYVVLNGMTL